MMPSLLLKKQKKSLKKYHGQKGKFVYEKFKKIKGMKKNQ